jgi:hypothetical protein
MLATTSCKWETAKSWLGFAGGTVIGNNTGTSPHTLYGAWFEKASTPICYDIEIGQFPWGEADLERMIESRLNLWHDYLAFKGVANVYSGGGFKRFPRSPASNASAGCRERADLTFYFGTSEAHVAQLTNFSVSPSARSVAILQERFPLTTNEGNTSWGRGAIWLRPAPLSAPPSPTMDWSDRALVETVLLHEWGHVLGNPSVEGTITSDDHWKLVEEYYTRKLHPDLPRNAAFARHALQLMGEIDHARELVPCPPIVRELSAPCQKQERPLWFESPLPVLAQTLLRGLTGENYTVSAATAARPRLSLRVFGRTLRGLFDAGDLSLRATLIVNGPTGAPTQLPMVLEAPSTHYQGKSFFAAIDFIPISTIEARGQLMRPRGMKPLNILLRTNHVSEEGDPYNPLARVPSARLLLALDCRAQDLGILPLAFDPRGEADWPLELTDLEPAERAPGGTSLEQERWSALKACLD